MCRTSSKLITLKSMLFLSTHLFLSACEISLQIEPKLDGGITPIANECVDGEVESRLRYQSAIVPFDSICVSETQTRSCSEGQLTSFSGSFSYESCEVASSLELPSEVISDFKIGDVIELTRVTNVRSSGLIDATTLLGKQPIGSVGTIVEGPTQTDDRFGLITWWKVDFQSGVDGIAGEDNFKIHVTSGANDSENSAPVAQEDLIFSKKNQIVTINPLLNDSDMDGDLLSVVSIGETQFGEVVLEQNAVLFTPAVDFIGGEEIEYTVSDSKGLSSVGVIRIQVEDDAPISGGQGCFCGSTDPKAPCTSDRVEIAYTDSDKVTFMFDQEVYCGEFASSAHQGEDRGTRFWVAPKVKNGALVLSSTLPAMAGSGAETRNGLMEEPDVRKTGFPFTGGVDGFDTRFQISDGASFNTGSFMKNNLGIGARTIFKSVSNLKNLNGTTTTEISRCTNTNRNCELFIAPLTIVSAPPGNVFAPGFFRDDSNPESKIMIPASAYNPNLLGDLPATTGMIDFQAAHNTLKHVHFDNVGSDFHFRQLHGGEINYNSGRGYPGFKNQMMWDAYMRMNTRANTSEELKLKREMGAAVVQRAIDLYMIHKFGKGKHENSQYDTAPCAAFAANGGFGSGGLGTLIIGLTLINKTDWLAEINERLQTPAGRSCFGETYMVQPPNPSGSNIPLFGGLTTSVYKISSGTKTAGDPNGFLDQNGNLASPCGNGYHTQNAALYSGMILAARSTKGAVQNWPSNAQYLFDFVDRSFAGEDGYVYGKCSLSEGFTRLPFTSYMPKGLASFWSAYNDCLKNGSCH